jgi:hypothetical protein
MLSLCGSSINGRTNHCSFQLAFKAKQLSHLLAVIGRTFFLPTLTGQEDVTLICQLALVETA